MTTNNYLDFVQIQNRKKVLIVVEGNLEKNMFIKLIIQCFPELNINLDNVFIYGADIYRLYDEIVENYGDDWESVDLPFVISKSKTVHKNPYNEINETLYKVNFTDILLIFDYQRHDLGFSIDKINKMQSYFNDVGDVGQLYLNYPMLESYLEYEVSFLRKIIPLDKGIGDGYKKMINNNLLFSKINLANEISEVLEHSFFVNDVDKREDYISKILLLNNFDDLHSQIDRILADMEEKLRCRAKFHVLHLLCLNGHIQQNQSYYEYMREVFKQILKNNVLKAHNIQNRLKLTQYNSSFYDSVDLMKILDEQNFVSSLEDKPYIWVLNTSLFIVGDYNYRLLV